jgi:hypothetical protein
MRRCRLGVSVVSVSIMGLTTTSTAWAAPPEPAQPLAPTEVQTPAEPPAEPLDAAPEPAPEPQPQPQPSPIQPAEPEPEPEASGLPSYDSDIPSYAEAPPEPVVPARAPLEGRGRIAVGSVVLGGGVVLLGVSSAMISIDEDLAAWIPGAVVSAAAIAAGIGLVITGHQRKQKYRKWADAQGGSRAIPKSGIGLVASGITCIAAGSIGVIMGGVSLGILEGVNDMPYGIVLMPIGGVSMATGIGLLAAGAVRHRKYTQWNTERGLTPVVAPIGGLGRGLTGASFGIAGRF